MEPRQEVLENGGRTVLGAKWPAGIEDTILRYMPSVAGAIYIKREGEIPGRPGAAGSASSWAVWVTGRHGWHPFSETGTFLHELMHLYERQLRLACWHQNQEINGWISDKRTGCAPTKRTGAFLAERDRPLREPDGEPLTEYQLARETLAWFAEDYFTPEALVLQWPGRNRICDSSGCRPGKNENFKTYRELEQYAPKPLRLFREDRLRALSRREALAARQPGRGGLAGHVHCAAERGCQRSGISPEKRSWLEGMAGRSAADEVRRPRSALTTVVNPD